jgi:hypothetical protein
MTYKLKDWAFCVDPSFEVAKKTRDGRTWMHHASILGIQVNGEIHHHVLDLLGIPWKGSFNRDTGFDEYEYFRGFVQVESQVSGAYSKEDASTPA